MDDFYIQRGGWKITMLHGGNLVPGRVLIYVQGSRNNNLEWSLRDPIYHRVLRSGTFGHIDPAIIEAAALGPISLPQEIHGKSVESKEWEDLARANTLNPESEFKPGIGDEAQWIVYVPKRDADQDELP